MEPRPAEYGVLEQRNIDLVRLGDREFETWYGNGAYFPRLGSDKLGIDTSAKRRALPQGFWLEKLFVCEMCFRYSAESDAMLAHRATCLLKTQYPAIGQTVYAEMRTPYVIKRVRGFRDALFCQNLALFGKLFLMDKLVFYNVEAFDFYVVYGQDAGFLTPMGFFLKEVNSWEPDVNLACICVFPPFQKLRLGSLLLEFLYSLAKVTPGQARLGPELPLSPFGKALYLRFWAKTLAYTLQGETGEVTLDRLADATGFRKDDVLMALEYMGVLRQNHATVVISTTALNVWCEANNVDQHMLSRMLDPQYLLI